MTDLQLQRLEQEIKGLKADIIVLKRLFAVVKIEPVELKHLTTTEQKWVRKALRDVKTRSRKDWLTLEELKAEIQK